WINRLAVHPDYRRTHIASRLVRTCEHGLGEQGIQIFAALIEPDNAASKAVFRSLGYEIQPMLYVRRKSHPGVYGMTFSSLPIFSYARSASSRSARFRPAFTMFRMRARSFATIGQTMGRAKTPS